jgi:ketosteroid isomerase-like protein
MQHQPTLSREELITLATRTYFGAVDAKDLAGTLACFHDSALFHIQTAFTTHEGRAGLERMFTDFFAAWEQIVHRDFVCTVDAAHGRIAASFEAVLTAADGQVTRLFNTNFWKVRDGRFQEVHVYMSGANVLV